MDETTTTIENILSSNEPKKAFKKTTGYLVVGALGAVSLGISVVSFSFIVPAFRKICLPFVPATDNQVKNVLKFLKNRKGPVLDLGSGDGRLVIESAKLGLKSDGVELNPWLVLYSKISSYRSGVSTLTKFHHSDLWKTNLQTYNNIIIFGVEEMMQQLEVKASKELNSGSWVIACRFPLPNWKPIHVEDEGIDSVWVYEKK